MTVDSTLQALKDWKGGGRDACLATTLAHMDALPQPAALFSLSQTLQVLVQSLLSTSPNQISADSLADFTNSLLHSASSSSLEDPRAVLTESILDVIWTVDTKLEDDFNYAKSFSPVDSLKVILDQNRQCLGDFVKSLVLSSIVAPSACREALDLHVLSAAGLVGEPNAIEKKVTRVRTTLFYKQTNFNLLREESEGYSKLVTQVVAMIGPPHDPTTGFPVENKDALQTRARLAWDKIIDIFSTHVLNHYAFFLELLRCSPWTRPTTFTQYDRRLRSRSSESPTPSAGQYEGLDFDDVLRLAEREEGVPDLADHNIGETPVIGQILGFKFVQYQSPEKSDSTGRKLYVTAALLIREGLVKLDDVYPHLSPPDVDMEKDFARYQNHMKEKVKAAQSSGLPSMGDAPSRGSSSSLKPRTDSAQAAAPSNAARDLPNQKYGLLRALLSMGSLRPAFFILTRFPWLPKAHPELADLFLHMIHTSLSNVRDPLSFPVSRIRAKSQPNTDRIIIEANAAPKAIPKKKLIVVHAPTPPSNQYTDFTYFYPAWLDTVPICATRKEIFTVVEPLLRHVGVNAHRDIGLLTQLCRIGKVELSEATKSKTVGLLEKTQANWKTMLRLYLLPALSMTRANAVYNVEIWNVLRFFDQTERWGMYGEWALAHTMYPEVKVRHVEVTREVRGILRRVTVNTNNKLSLPLAKLAHSNPCLVFAECVKQAMAYDNLIEAIAESARSLTLFGYDVLVYSILVAFSNSSKPRMKEDGTSVALWLQSLSTYTATIFKKFGASTDPVPILKYVAHRLKRFRSADLIVLRELISQTTNIKPQANLTDDQVNCMSGGPTIRIEALAPDTRGSLSITHQLSNRNATRRLTGGLKNADLAIPLLILIAQQRELCIETVDKTEEHLKHISNLYDECQAVLFQYVEFLITAFGDEYGTMLPTLHELCNTFKLQPDVAFHLWRPALHGPILAHNISVAGALLVKKDQEALRAKEEAEAVEKRLKMALAAKRTPSIAVPPAVLPPDAPSISDSSKDTGLAPHDTRTPIPMEVDIPGLQPRDDVAASPEPSEPWLPQLLPLIASAKQLLSSDTQRVLSAGFYTTFWQMSMYDLTLVAKPTEREVGKINALLKSGQSRDKKLEEHLILTRNQLLQELKDQIENRRAVQERLNRERNHWFSPDSLPHEVVRRFAQECLHPRCVLSPTDAEYCAKIIKSLHTIGTPHYSTLGVYDNLFGLHLADMVFSLSEHQVNNYGRFYRLVFEDVEAWCGDEKSFKGGKPPTSRALPGFQKKWSSAEEITYSELLTLAEFNAIATKWKNRLSKALIQCLQSGSYVGVRNAVIFLNSIASVFPKIARHGEPIVQCLEQLLQSEKRPDLLVLLKSLFGHPFSYSTLLHLRKPSWVPEPTRIQDQGVNGASKSTVPIIGQTFASPASSDLPSKPQPAESIHSSPPPLTSLSDVKGSIASIPRPPVVKRVRNVAGTEEGLRGTTPDSSLLKPSNATDGSEKSSFNIEEPTQEEAPSVVGPKAGSVKTEMPPPSAPSSTSTALALRPTAQQNMNPEPASSAIESVIPRAATPTEPSKFRKRSRSPASHSRAASIESRSSNRDARSRPDRDARRPGRDRENGKGSYPRDEHNDGDRVAIVSHRGDDDDRHRERARDKDRKERDHRSAKEKDEREKIRDRPRDHEREKDRDIDRDREKDRDRDRDRERDRIRDKDSREKERSRRESHSDVAPRKEKELASTSRASRRDPKHDGGQTPTEKDRGRGIHSSDDNPHKRRRLDDEDSTSSKRVRSGDALRYVATSSAEKDRDVMRDREVPRERHRDERNRRDKLDMRDEKREVRRHRRDREESDTAIDKRGSTDTTGDNYSVPAQTPTPLPSRAPPTGPRATRGHDGARVEDEGTGDRHSRDTPRSNRSIQTTSKTDPSPLPARPPGGKLVDRISTRGAERGDAVISHPLVSMPGASEGRADPEIVRKDKADGRNMAVTSTSAARDAGEASAQSAEGSNASKNGTSDSTKKRTASMVMGSDDAAGGSKLFAAATASVTKRPKIDRTRRSGPSAKDAK